ncbi:unnamed protein product [Ectocarpus sp. 4 AP-2014]
MSEAGGRSELNQQQARIHPTVVKKLLQLHWNKDPAADGAKINLDAAVLTAEYLRLFVIGEAPRLALMTPMRRCPTRSTSARRLLVMEAIRDIQPLHLSRTRLSLLVSKRKPLSTDAALTVCVCPTTTRDPGLGGTNSDRRRQPINPHAR